MHEIVFYAAFVWMTLLLIVRALAVAQILAHDMLTLILIALLVLYADWQRTPYLLDAALVRSLLAFIATLVLARFHGEGQVFYWPLSL